MLPIQCRLSVGDLQELRIRIWILAHLSLKVYEVKLLRKIETRKGLREWWEFQTILGEFHSTRFQ